MALEQRNDFRHGVATKSRILDVAERLFAEFGFNGTSLRMITAEAGVNLAAVNYHFGSKEALIESVFTRRLGPLNLARLAELDALEQASQGKPLAVEATLRAFVGAALKVSTDPAEGAIFLRLLGRAFTEPTEQIRNILQKQYEAVASRFKSALMKSLPAIPEPELVWRMHFMFGSISYTLAGTDALQLVGSCKLCDANDHEAIFTRLTHFLAAGLKAPLPPATVNEA